MRTKNFAAVAALAFAALAVAAQDSVVLKRTFKADSTEVYVVETANKSVANIQGQEMESEAKTTMIQTVKVKEVDAAKGTAKISLTTKIDKMEGTGFMEQAAQGMKDAPAIEQTGTWSPNNSVVFDKTKGGNPMMAMVLGSASRTSGVFFALPEKPVKVGDTWDIVIPKSPETGPADQKLTATLTGIKDGHAMFSVTGKVTYATTISGEAAGGQVPGDMKIKGATDLKADVTVDAATGQTLEAKLTTKEKGTVGIEAAGMTIDTSGSSTITVTLKK